MQAPNRSGPSVQRSKRIDEKNIASIENNKTNKHKKRNTKKAHWIHVRSVKKNHDERDKGIGHNK